jgi:hypothetical protein
MALEEPSCTSLLLLRSTFPSFELVAELLCWLLNILSLKYLNQIVLSSAARKVSSSLH